jgi:tetratricopeptide (TPR) repeat protein
MLIVLDNASDADQVRPLLPGAPPCCVLITSRHALSGLVVDHGAHSVAIEPLSAAESRDLLLTRLRDQHDTIDAGTLDRILTACGGVPLALALVAARAAAQTAAPTATPTSTVLDTLARDLTDNATVLDALAVGDTTTDLRNVLSWSYRKLDPRAGQLFRLIGLYPGTDIGLPALASLSGSPAAQVSRTAKDLVNAHLLTQAPLGGRYSCHDLLHAYANELLQNHDPAATRQAATDRLLNHYARSAYAAAELLDPNDYDTATACLSGVTVNRPTDHDRALDWFRIEHRTLIEATRLAAATGRDHVTLELANVLRIFLGRQGHWHDQLTVQRLAVDAAHRLADATAEAHAHRRLASGLVELGRYHEARGCHQRALEIYAQTPDLLGQVDTQLSLTRLYERQTLHRQALQHAAQALDLCSKIDNPERHAMALGAVGWCHSMLGEHDTALTYCEQAAELVRHTSARQTEANIWDSLGYIHHHLGHHAQATACYHHALAIFRHLDDRFNTAETLDHLADSYLHSGDTEQANDARLEALRILAELDHPHTEQIRHKLTDPTLAPAAASILSPT